PPATVPGPLAPPLPPLLPCGSEVKDSSPRFLVCSSRSRSPDTPSPLLVPPRSSSCPTARFDSERLFPHVPTLSSVVRASAVSEPASFARASPATLVSDSLAVLPSGATTRSRVDSHTQAFLRKPRRFVHPPVDPLGCLAVSSGSTSSSD